MMNDNNDILHEIISSDDDDDSVQQQQDQVVLQRPPVLIPSNIASVRDPSALSLWFQYQFINSNQTLQFWANRHYNIPYNINTDEHTLHLVLNQICDLYPNLDKIIIQGNTLIDSAVLLYFVHKQRQNNNENVVIQNRTLVTSVQAFLGNNIYNRDLIHASIKNNSFFPSWIIEGYTDADLIFVLNALKQNRYIQSLKINLLGTFNHGEQEMQNNVTITDILLNKETKITNQLCDSYSNLDKIKINYLSGIDNSGLVLLFFTQIQNHINNDYINTLPLVGGNRKIIIDDFFALEDNSNNRELIRSSIKNCSFFTSWHLYITDQMFVLSALAQNSYIQCLEISSCRQGDRVEEERLINSIIDMLSHTRTLSKLILKNMKFSSSNKVASLTETLISSETVTDLSFEGFNFSNKESFKNMNAVLKRKANIKKLKLDPSLLKWNDNSTVYSIHFESSLFSNLLLNNRNDSTQHHNQLQELDVSLLKIDANHFVQIYPENLLEELSLFFLLLKDSFVEKLTITLNLGNFPEELCKTLLEDTIPFMSRLCFFGLHFDARGFNNFEMPTSFKNSLIKSLGKCNRTLLEVKTTVKERRGDSGRHIDLRGIQNYLKRNGKLTTACRSRKSSSNSKSSLPKLFYCAKPTGPDAVYSIIRNLGLSIRTKDEALLVTTASITEKSTVVEHKRKYS